MINTHNIKFATIGWFFPTHLLPTHKKPANCANFFSLAANLEDANVAILRTDL